MRGYTSGCQRLQPPSPFPATLGAMCLRPGLGVQGSLAGKTRLLFCLHSECYFLGWGCEGGTAQPALPHTKSKGDAANLGDTQHQHRGEESSGYTSARWRGGTGSTKWFVLLVLLTSSSVLVPGWWVSGWQCAAQERKQLGHSVSDQAGVGVHSQTISCKGMVPQS